MVILRMHVRRPSVTRGAAICKLCLEIRDLEPLKSCLKQIFPPFLSSFLLFFRGLFMKENNTDLST